MSKGGDKKPTIEDAGRAPSPMLPKATAPPTWQARGTSSAGVGRKREEPADPEDYDDIARMDRVPVLRWAAILCKLKPTSASDEALVVRKMARAFRTDDFGLGDIRQLLATALQKEITLPPGLQDKIEKWHPEELPVARTRIVEGPAAFEQKPQADSENSKGAKAMRSDLYETHMAVIKRLLYMVYDGNPLANETGKKFRTKTSVARDIGHGGVEHTAGAFPQRVPETLISLVEAALAYQGEATGDDPLP